MTAIRIDDYTPRREDYEPATDWCIAGPLPGMRHTPSDTYTNGSGRPVRDHDYEPDPDRRGMLRMARGPDGRPTVSRTRDQQSLIATGQSAELIARMQPSLRRVTVHRIQEVEVEVDAYSDVEATWVAAHRADGFTDDQWTTTELRSGFHRIQPQPQTFEEAEADAEAFDVASGSALPSHLDRTASRDCTCGAVDPFSCVCDLTTTT